MKNAIIIVLAAALAFFIARSLGVIRPASIMSDSRSAHVQRRVQAVRSAPTWKYGITTDDGSDFVLRDAVDGMRTAADLVNANGGTAGKNIEILVRQTLPWSMTGYKLNMQEFCKDPQTAVFASAYSSIIPSVSTLTQYQALPLLSPITVPNPEWEPLDPDNYASVYMPLRLMARAIVDDLYAKGYRRVLVINPAGAADCLVFTRELGNQFHSRIIGGDLFVIDYDTPLNPAMLQNTLAVYLQGTSIDAIVFTSVLDELHTCLSILDSLGIRIPVYGSDNLDQPEVEEALRQTGWEISYAQCRFREPLQGFDARYKELTGRPPTIWSYYGCRAVIVMAQSLEYIQNYHPDTFAQAARRFARQFWQSHANAVKLRRVQKEETSDAH